MDKYFKDESIHVAELLVVPNMGPPRWKDTFPSVLLSVFGYESDSGQ